MEFGASPEMIQSICSGPRPFALRLRGGLAPVEAIDLIPVDINHGSKNAQSKELGVTKAFSGPHKRILEVLHAASRVNFHVRGRLSCASNYFCGR